MLMKNLGAQLQAEENMSNLTSASTNEASVSSGNRNDNNGAAMFSTQYHHDFPAHLSTNQAQPPLKKKRNQPGHPDPEAEVISLSPRSLLATNRFVCEICNKGFQRDQNLQLHRRGHNLPWKLKQRSSKEVVRKKVYVCPETSCVHHEPSRALGDLTGIKKHFSRKHGEKKWKCDKCSKKYAVQSDWKAHSKTCGTREYRCDCGTLFSRRDSFITHRAFCDALAEESARSGTAKNTTSASSIQQIQSQFINTPTTFPPIKKEHQHQQHHISNFMNFPPWLSHPNYPQSTSAPLDQLIAPPSPSLFQEFHQNPNPNLGPTLLPQYPPPPPPPPPPHISATALLQKAAQMGSKSSSTAAHVSGAGGLSLLSRDGFMSSSGLASYGNIKAANLTVTAGGTMTGHSHSHSHNHHHPSSGSLFHDMMMMGNPGAFDHDRHGFEEALDFHAALDEFSQSRSDDNNGNIISDGMTRDFLGLRALSQSDIMSIAGLSNCMDSGGGAAACNNDN